MMAALRKDRPWRLAELLEGVMSVPDEANLEVADLCSDSRDIQGGELFVAYPAYQGDGREHIDDALARGAVAALAHCDAEQAGVHWSRVGDGTPTPIIRVPGLKEQVGVIADRFFASPSKALAVVGVTGTNGKTSCSHYIAQALADKKCGIVGTLGWGFPGDLQHSTHTTPDVINLHRWLATLRGQGAQAVAMEVSSHALDQQRVAGVRFDCAVFTNLSHDHLDYHGDMDRYGQAKRALFHRPGLQYAIINKDDVFSARLLEGLAPEVTPVTYGVEVQQADVLARNVRAEADGLRFEVTTPVADMVLHVPLLGRFNVSNVLAVLSVLLVKGLAPQQAKQRLEQLQPVAGRMQQLQHNDWPMVVVDYAHTPAALEHALQALREHTSGALWCVFGCGGERDRTKRAPMGRIAELHADHVIVTNDNPRHEDPRKIAEAIQAGMERPDTAIVMLNRAEAIARAMRSAREHDVVLVAGKGHEDYQLIGDQRLEFSDTQEVIRIFGGARG